MPLGGTKVQHLRFIDDEVGITVTGNNVIFIYGLVITLFLRCSFEDTFMFIFTSSVLTEGCSAV
jgi:hypothetical protein